MTKKIFLLVGFLLLSRAASAIDTVATGYRAVNSTTPRIDAWGKCRDVANTSGRDQFVATKTQPEWWSFITNPPSGINNTICPIQGEYTTSVAKVIPAAADGVTVAGAGTAWGNSAWVQLTASTANAVVLTGVMVDSGNAAVEFEVDIGRGAAGSETVIATLAGKRVTAAGGPWWLELPIPIDNIATGQRVAVRFRKEGNAAAGWVFKAGYYDKPLGGSVAVTSAASKVIPTATTGTSVTPNATAWASSNWFQVTASTATAVVFGGFVVNPGDTGEYELDIGTGAAGSETVVATLRENVQNGNGGPYAFSLKPALDNIATGTRVAVRMRKATTTTAAWTFKLIYYQAPTGLTLPAAPLKWSPTAAASAAITPSGTAWNNSAWTQLIASASTDLQIAAIEIDPTASAEFEIELGVGAAGSEIPIGSIKGNCLSTGLFEYTLPFRPLLDSVPAGARVAARMRKSGTTTTSWGVSVGYYEGTSSSNTASSYKKVFPSAAASTSLTPSGTNWGNSAYIQLTASTSNQILVNSIVYSPGANEEFEIDVATGAAGSETVIGTVAGNVGNANGNQIIYFPVPILVASSTRVALRLRKAGTNTGAWTFSMNYTDVQ